jgi:lysophospholipase L1-like esterase
MNQIHWIIIIISIIIIFGCAFIKTTREGLTPNNNIILIGDSVLNNSAYVPSGKSVFDNLKEKTSNVFNFAKDGATIQDCYAQLDNISSNFNNTNTYVFISIGGNDILNKRGQLSSEEINSLFQQFLSFIDALNVKLGSVNLNICNLYLPSDPRFQNYKSSIDQWNILIKENSNRIGAMYNILDLYSLLNTPNDFIYSIEPSPDGSVKIANLIYLTN